MAAHEIAFRADEPIWHVTYPKTQSFTVANASGDGEQYAIVRSSVWPPVNPAIHTGLTRPDAEALRARTGGADVQPYRPVGRRALRVLNPMGGPVPGAR